MNLLTVADEIRTTLGTITSLRIPPWGVKAAQVPAAIVTVPDLIQYDATFMRGLDEYPDWPLVVLVGMPDERASIKNLAAYVEGSGAKSIKAVLEAHTWVACGVLTVTSAEIVDVTYAGTEYLSATFHLKIIGNGA